MSHLEGLITLVSGMAMLALAGALFWRAKLSAKRCIRKLVKEDSSPEEEYQMIRSLLSIVVLGSLFYFLCIWGAARILNVEAWVSVIAKPV